MEETRKNAGVSSTYSSLQNPSHMLSRQRHEQQDAKLKFD